MPSGPHLIHTWRALSGLNQSVSSFTDKALYRFESSLVITSMTIVLISRSRFHVFVRRFLHSLSSFNARCVCPRQEGFGICLCRRNSLKTIVDAEFREEEVLSTLGSSDFEMVHTCCARPDLMTRKEERLAEFIHCQIIIPS